MYAVTTDALGQIAPYKSDFDTPARKPSDGSNSLSLDVILPGSNREPHGSDGFIFEERTLVQSSKQTRKYDYSFQWLNETELASQNLWCESRIQ